MMYRKYHSLLFFIFTIFTFISCSDNVTPGFTYSPEMPKRGHKVTFTNTTTGDDDWKADSWGWRFGDGYTSTSESPVHTYTRAGVYTVTLMVDSNKHLTKSLELSVYDTIPVIYTDVDSVEYYRTATFKFLAYNPYSEDVTYEWHFSNNAVSDQLVKDSANNNLKCNDKTVKVYFTQRNIDEYVNLEITIGDSIYNVPDTVFIHDIKARSILMAQKGGDILRQRILENGFEDFTNTGISSGKYPFNIKTGNNLVYIFDAGDNYEYNANWLTDTSGNGNIRAAEISDATNSHEVINNNGKSSHFGFFNGYIDDDYIYWTDYSEFLYKTALNSSLGNFIWNGSSDAQTTVPYYLAKVDRLGYYGNGLSSNQMSGGICYFDDVYFWAKGGSGKGIYRFLASDILTANATNTTSEPSLGAILSDYSIRAFTIDEINQKIYFSVTAPADKIGLWVSNMSGNNAARIDDAPMDDASLYITGIAVDNESNKVYWAYRSPETVGASAPSGYTSWADYYSDYPTHRTGIKMASLATLYKPAGSVEYFREGIIAYGICLDKYLKY
ncbi:MAG: PKD domain-containing protein [Paludibacter sp.]|nr:PKD domain-containing protein [Paludibacter sp.]